MLIKTKRLTLEPLSVRHFESTKVYSTDPENTRMMCFLPCDSVEEVLDYLKKCDIQWSANAPEYLDAALILDGEHIGAVSIEILEDGSIGELGWIIRKNYWGKGYAVEGAEAFIGYFKERFGITHYIAHCDADNTASIRVMEKLGMDLKDRYYGRKNRNSENICYECLYELFV